jgi:hypothetical protein
VQIGLNTELDFEGVTYHVQTEDHGLKRMKIQSQIFNGGQILDTINISYEKSIADLDGDDNQRDKTIRKKMRALHALCYRNIQGGKYLPGKKDKKASLSAEAEQSPGEEVKEAATEEPRETKPRAQKKATKTELPREADEAPDKELDRAAKPTSTPPLGAERVAEKSRGEVTQLEEIEGASQIPEQSFIPVHDAGSKRAFRGINVPAEAETISLIEKWHADNP